ncbi:MAG TPA: UDP-glucose/GDP-mannose dehydrogenase family protein [Candidatus Thermoplasmatota archaeon]|nr:UDP-glucose/GDP-mannose dehydrogenase family protein [Candidatus Thermoplasmatota archaeon]
MRIAIVGAGYVGTCTGVAFAEQGHDVVLVDADPSRVAALAAARPPFHEPGLPEALASLARSKRLTATTQLPAAVRGADAVFLCVGTPSRKDGSLDDRFVRQAARQVGEAVARARPPGPLVVVKSTVLPGTTDGVVRKELERASGLRAGSRFALAANPEFLREGAALADARAPDRVVVGGVDDTSTRRALALYETLDCPKVAVDARTAEMIKYASNAMLAARVALVNEIANLCAASGIDVEDVARGVGLDSRIGPHFLRAGAGFGGSCFPKDVRALAAAARKARRPAPVLQAVLAQNKAQPLEVVRLAKQALGALRGKRIALLGLAFKPDTDDVRETRALPIWRALVRAGAKVACYDPVAGENFRRLAGRRVVLAASLTEAIDGADAAVIQAEWPQFRLLAAPEWARRMRRPLVIDGRRSVDARRLRAAGVEYLAVGLGRRVG